MELLLIVLFVMIVVLIWTLLDEDYKYDPIKRVEDDQNLVVVYKKTKK